jgi:hypothetical protein
MADGWLLFVPIFSSQRLETGIVLACFRGTPEDAGVPAGAARRGRDDFRQ